MCTCGNAEKKRNFLIAYRYPTFRQIDTLDMQVENQLNYNEANRQSRAVHWFGILKKINYD